MSSLSFFSCAYTDSVPIFTVIPVSCFSSMCCQAFNFKSILISPLDFGRNDSVFLRLICLYKKLNSVKQYIISSMYTHTMYTSSSHWYDVRDYSAKKITLKKKAHSFYTMSDILLTLHMKVSK